MPATALAAAARRGHNLPIRACPRSPGGGSPGLAWQQHLEPPGRWGCRSGKSWAPRPSDAGSRSRQRSAKVAVRCRVTPAHACSSSPRTGSGCPCPSPSPCMKGRRCSSRSTGCACCDLLPGLPSGAAVRPPRTPLPSPHRRIPTRWRHRTPPSPSPVRRRPQRQGAPLGRRPVGTATGRSQGARRRCGSAGPCRSAVAVTVTSSG